MEMQEERGRSRSGLPKSIMIGAALFNALLVMSSYQGDGDPAQNFKSLVFLWGVAFLAWVWLVLGGVIFWWGEPVWPYTLLFFVMLAFPYIFIVWPVILGTLAWGGYRTWQQRRQART